MPRALQADAPERFEEVARGLHVRRGLDVDAAAGNADAIANVGFIVGGHGVFVTDSGGSLADGMRLRAAVRAVTDKPITHVLMSHIHPDHIFGAGAFVADKPEFVGHARLPESLAARGEFYRLHLNEILGPGQAGPIVQPTLLVEGTREIDLGGRVLALTAHQPAHTSSDVSVLDRETGTLLPADLLFVGRAPALDGSLKGWLAELAALSQVKAARAVPGHGPVAVDFASGSGPLVRYLTKLRDETRAAIAADTGIEKASETVAGSERGAWTLFAEYNPRNVTEAYKELEWE
ncbi:MAG TPA: quinoprotein relay system zinc metallohydrolase 2 [Acetobacteraceae bacterium]|nr:quinoprotein relay system zinc metallohydrolase 2 [Acetobacteraceae bacterium]